MRAFITGATGFIGSHVAEQLVDAGHSVAVLVRPASPLDKLDRIRPRLTLIEGDLGQIDPWRAELADFGPEAVLHLAWAGVGSQYRDDREQFQSNLANSLRLLDVAAEVGASSWLGLGSQAEYGPQNRRIDETAPTCPTTLYGAVKLSCFHLAQHLARLHGLRFAWLRVFSTYGPGDSPHWMYSSLILDLLAGKRPRLTWGEQLWDYLHVVDAARAVCAVALCPQAEGPFNLGSGQVHSIRWLAETIRDLVDPSLPLGLGEVDYRPDQVMHLEADTTRLRTATGWRPEVDLAEGLRQTVEWYCKHGPNL